LEVIQIEWGEEAHRDVVVVNGIGCGYASSTELMSEPF
jgi:hypothetical protein